MDINKFFLLLVFVVLSGSVSATFGAVCQGNNLVYYDLDNKPIVRDCSILHSGEGQVFRGICKEYQLGGGADCYRTEGLVSSQYRDAVRGYTYNASISPWDPEFVINTTTTTTLIKQSIIQCPKCDVCQVCDDCSRFRDLVFLLNSSNNNNKANADAYKAQVSSMVDKQAYLTAIQDKNKQINESLFNMVQCTKEKSDISGWNNTYLTISGISVAIMLAVVVIWIKYEFYGARVEDPFGPEPKKKVK